MYKSIKGLFGLYNFPIDQDMDIEKHLLLRRNTNQIIGATDSK